MTRFDVKFIAVMLIVLVVVILATSCDVAGDITPDETLPPITAPGAVSV